MSKLCGVGLITFLIGSSMADSINFLIPTIIMLVGLAVMNMGARYEAQDN